MNKRLVVSRGWGVGRTEMLAKGCALSVVRGISSRDLTYSMVAIVDNTVLYT